MARPTAAMSQREAAVVRPLILFPRRIMAPAPRNPIPETTWAAILPGSPPLRELYSWGSQIERSIKRVEPVAMRMWVRIPAAWRLLDRSKPTIAPARNPKHKRIIMSAGDNTTVFIIPL
jgi:hypothetical protein